MRFLTWILSFLAFALFAGYVALMQLTSTELRPIERPTTADFSNASSLLRRLATAEAQSIEATSGQLWLASQANFARLGYNVNQQFIIHPEHLLWQLDWPVAQLGDNRFLPVDAYLIPTAQFPYVTLSDIRLAEWRLPSLITKTIAQRLTAQIDNQTAALWEASIKQVRLDEQKVIIELN